VTGPDRSAVDRPACPVDPPHAEDLHVDERLVTAPVAGLFHPLVFDVAPDDPLRIADGDEIGIIVRSGEKHPVSCRFTGLLAGMLVLPGERVRIHQPVAWLRSAPLDGADAPSPSPSP
jgi:hypothetical protein